MVQASLHAEQMGTTPKRLFIGGLNGTIGSVALLSLLKPFGATTVIHGCTSRGFAHVSFTSATQETIDRCVRTLNHTKWRSVQLRVERAREHFTDRLKREWDEVNCTATDSASNDHLPHGDEASVDGSAKFSWKGKRKRFEDTDEDIDEDIDDDVDDTAVRVNGESEDDSGAIISQPCTSSGAASLQDAKEKAEGTQRDEKLHKKRRKAASAVTSTLQLFGLSTDAASSPSKIANRANGSKGLGTSPPGKSPPTREDDEKHQHQNKVPIDLTLARAVEEDAQLIDFSMERANALSIVEAMFPSSEGAGDETADRETAILRPGLYRKLRPSLRCEKTVQVPVVVLRGLDKADVAGKAHRRAGLYKKLLASG